MRRLATLLLLALTYVRAESPEEAGRAMAESESKFCAVAQEKGTRAAFLDFFADDAVVFRPGPEKGKEVWRNRKTDLELLWQQTLVTIARSADFGYDIGPSKWRVARSKEEWTYAYFISIWKKQKDGDWKVVVDCATENPQPGTQSEPLRVRVVEAKTSSNSAAFAEIRSHYLVSAKRNFADAFQQFASDEVRAYRDGAVPCIGKDACTVSLSPHSGGLSMEVLKTDISRSDDLAYYYGRYSDPASENQPMGHFLQIWSKGPAGAWKLVLDWQQPLPAAQ